VVYHAVSYRYWRCVARHQTDDVQTSIIITRLLAGEREGRARALPPQQLVLVQVYCHAIQRW